MYKLPLFLISLSLSITSHAETGSFPIKCGSNTTEISYEINGDSTEKFAMLINGSPLTTVRSLNNGDVLAAGRSAKGISKLPLTASVG